MEIIKAILSVLTWMDYLFVAVVMLLITYMGGAFCRDIREMHASRARTRARAEWIEEHPDQSTFDEKNDTAIGHQENAAADAILRQNAWRYVGGRTAQGLSRWMRSWFAGDAWRRRWRTLTGRPEPPSDDHKDSL